MNELKKIISEFVNKVKDNPGTIFGILYPYILTVVIIIGLYYVANIGIIAVNKTSAFVPDSSLVADLPVLPARTVPPIDIFKLKEPTNELVQKGKELYSANCASCHNETGAGGGPAAVGLNPAPRNFKNPDGWKNGKTISGIYSTLEDGIEGSAMISYNFLTPEERISIAHYIRQEFIQEPPADSDDELSALNSLYNLSSGMEVPAQIPINTAIEILQYENIHKYEKLDNALSKVKKDKNQVASTLFLTVVENKKLALSALVNNDSWRESDKAFVDFVSSNINQNGFNSNVMSLSASERIILTNYLKQIL